MLVSARQIFFCEELSCTKTEHLFVRTAEQNLYSRQENKNFTLPKGSPTNRKDAKLAVPIAKNQSEETNVKCSLRCAPNVVKLATFLSNQGKMVAQFIAATAFPPEEVNGNLCLRNK